MHFQYDSTLGIPPDERPIFVVDDDENDRAVLLSALREAGNHNPCHFFSTGDEIVEALLAVLQGAPLPLVCFLDVNMAGMSGLDVLRWIRLQDALSEVSVVMLTSTPQPASLNTAIRFGAQCYAGKFPSPEQLHEILSEAEKYSAVASGHSAFKLPCNLLLGAH